MSTKKPDWIVVSFSGGKDSSAVTLRKIELGEHIDEVICCDTYKEFPAMYRHIERVKKIVEDAGIKFTVLRSDKVFDYLMFEEVTKKETLGRGWPTFKVRWCTGELKKDIIRNYLKDLNTQYNVIQCVGLAADEEYRLKRAVNQQPNKRYPLIEWGWTEEDALQYCYSKGFDWEGLYTKFKRVSCWCCPLKSLPELRALRTHCPDLWAELHEMDKKAWNQFRADYSVADLEIRFALEEERTAAGLSITNREFFNELKRKIEIKKLNIEKTRSKK
jgi:3'-phosphoadenosine 5'-phosphosulfate sulfotransferase (PAPS reductase)/FAD synthetase